MTTTLTPAGTELQSLLTHLILQDLRHHQLILLLESEGRDTELHHLDILSTVAALMGLPEQEITDQFAGIYTSYLEEAGRYEVTGRGDSLLHLARQCYTLLVACVEIEKRNAAHAA